MSILVLTLHNDYDIATHNGQDRNGKDWKGVEWQGNQHITWLRSGRVTHTSLSNSRERIGMGRRGADRSGNKSAGAITSAPKKELT